MRLERFRAGSIAEALTEVRRQMGEDALVLRTSGRVGDIEVLATTALDLYRFGATVRSDTGARRRGRRSLVVALVGPTGSGKTTTAAKLALNERGYAGGRVGIISLDTYKIGAYDQIQTYADLAGLPLDVVSDPREATRALKRMGDCDTVLVDCPGRSPMADDTDRAWWEALRAIEPDEIHLVLPGSIQPSVACILRRHLGPVEPTHLLLTKMDEVPGEMGVAEIAFALGLPTRWVTDGQGVPEDLHAGPERLVAALMGGSPRAWHPAEMAV